MEEILNSKQKHKWTSEQMQVPPQIDGESCGYRMLHNMNKVCKQQEIQIIEKEETALEGYMIEITKTMLQKQQDI